MLVFTPFPSNHLNDFSNDLNVFEKPLGCFRQTIRMNPENHLDDFAGRTKKKKKTLQKSFPKVLKSYFNTSQVRQETSFSIDALTKISPFNRHFYSHIHTIPTTENYFPVILQTKWQSQTLFPCPICIHLPWRTHTDESEDGKSDILTNCLFGYIQHWMVGKNRACLH